MDMRLELIVLPVTDVDRAKSFYRSAGFREDMDYAAGDDFRVVQFTPPGSEASITFGKGITGAVPGSVQGSSSSCATSRPRRRSFASAESKSATCFTTSAAIFYHESPFYEIPGPDPIDAGTARSRGSRTPTATVGSFRRCPSGRPGADRLGFR